MMYEEKSSRLDIGGKMESCLDKVTTQQVIVFLIIYGIGMLAYGFYGFGPVFGREEFFYVGQRGQTMSESYALAARPLFWFISHKLMPGSFVPVLGVALGTFFLSLSGLVFSAIFKVKRNIDTIIVSLLFSLMPIFSQQQSLHMWNVAFAMSVFFPVLAFYCVQKKTITSFILGSICLSLTIPCYQTMINVFLLTTVLYLVHETIANESDEDFFMPKVKITLRAFLAFIVSIAVYAPVYLYMTRGVTGGYTAFQNKKISTLSDLFNNIWAIISSFVKLVFSSDSYVYREDFHYIPKLMMLLICASFLMRWRGMDLVKRGLSLLFLIVVGSLCLRLESIPLAHFLDQPRLWAAAAVFVSFMGLMCIVDKSPIVRNIGYVCSVLLIISFVMFHNVQSFFTWNVKVHDFAVANRIAMRIEGSPHFKPNVSYYMHVVGKKEPSTVSRGLFDVPMRYNAIRTNSDFLPYVLSFIGVHQISYDWGNMSNSNVLNRIKQEANAMPKWPAEGSVKFTKDNLIILHF